MIAHPSSARRTAHGFTLVELLAVVVITGILAVAGVSLFSRSLSASKGTEAVSVIQALRSAEEAYSGENHIYLNVSTASGGTAWYPNLTPNTTRYAWVQSGHVDSARWQALAPAVSRGCLFGYLVYAGAPNTNVPPLQLAADPGFPKPMTLDWYVIQARGDVNGDKVYARYAASSLNSELVVENEGE